MFMEVPMLTRCCFCAPLRCGLLVWAYLKLILNILVFQFSIIFLSLVGDLMFFCECVFYILAVVFSALSLLFFDTIFSFVLIVGCHKKHTTLLRLYYRFGIVYAVLFLALSIITNAALMYVSRNPEIDGVDLWEVITVSVSICCVTLILHVYLLLLVRSVIFKLKPSGQFQFVNHIADPKCVMHVDLLSNDKQIGKFPERILP